MLMQMLRAGGMDVGNTRGPLYEDKRQNTEQPGPWVCEYEGKALKWLDPSNNPMFSGPQYYVIWMDREIKEQAKSRIKFDKRTAKRVGREIHLTRHHRGQTIKLIKERRPRALKVLRQLAEKLLVLRYESVLLDPMAAASRINEHCGGNLDVEAMAAVVAKRSPKCREGFLEDDLFQQGKNS